MALDVISFVGRGTASLDTMSVTITATRRVWKVGPVQTATRVSSLMEENFFELFFTFHYYFTTANTASYNVSCQVDSKLKLLLIQKLHFFSLPSSLIIMSLWRPLEGTTKKIIILLYYIIII